MTALVVGGPIKTNKLHFLRLDTLCPLKWGDRLNRDKPGTDVVFEGG